VISWEDAHFFQNSISIPTVSRTLVLFVH
jgi:hypothetical protein